MLIRYGRDSASIFLATPWASLDLVLAGQNHIAFDRACLWTMMLPQAWVQYLTYAARKDLGPTGPKA